MANEPNGNDNNGATVRLATNIVSAYVSHNQVATRDVPEMIKSVHNALTGLATKERQQSAPRPRPAVPIKRSVTPDYIVCLEDGKKLKMLKRYLRSNYNLSPEEYRSKWNLPPDYPMVAPNYAAQRSRFAKKIGLGKTQSAGSDKKQN